MLALLGLLIIGDFVAPATPPHADYRIQLKLDLDRSLISGTQTVRVTNTARRPLSQLAVSWAPAPGRTFQCEFEGRKLDPVNQKSPLVLRLPREWKPGESIELRMSFSMPRARPQDGASCLAWLTRNQRVPESSDNAAWALAQSCAIRSPYARKLRSRAIGTFSS